MALASDSALAYFDLLGLQLLLAQHCGCIRSVVGLRPRKTGLYGAVVNVHCIHESLATVSRLISASLDRVLGLDRQFVESFPMLI